MQLPWGGVLLKVLFLWKLPCLGIIELHRNQRLTKANRQSRGEMISNAEKTDKNTETTMTTNPSRV